MAMKGNGRGIARIPAGALVTPRSTVEPQRMASAIAGESPSADYSMECGPSIRTLAEASGAGIEPRRPKRTADRTPAARRRLDGIVIGAAVWTERERAREVTV